jgi:hypothetical protein
MRRAERKPFSVLLFDRADILRTYFSLLIFWAAAALAARSEIIDRVAVSVGNSAIAASDLDREIRITAFLNGSKPDFSPMNRRTTADRMVEQKLIRRELELSRYPAPEPSAVDNELAGFRKMNFKSDLEFRQALTGAGITEQEVRDELLWQLMLLRFIEVRFRPGVQVSEQEIQDYFEKTVKPAAQATQSGQTVTLEEYHDNIEDTLAGRRADQELDKWLKEVRQRTEVVYHEEAFQ